eukprot:3310842-Rhodomonas_salina.2
MSAPRSTRRSTHAMCPAQAALCHQMTHARALSGVMKVFSACSRAEKEKRSCWENGSRLT